MFLVNPTVLTDAEWQSIQVPTLASYERSIALGKAVFQHPDEPVPEEIPEDLVRAILASRGIADG